MEPLFPSEYLTFDMYFASLVGANSQPGKSIEDCARQALQMIQVRRSLIPSESSDE